MNRHIIRISILALIFFSYCAHALVGQIQPGESMWLISKKIANTVDIIESKVCLIDSQLDELRVSINSLREEVYESVMPPLKLKKVINNVETLITLREKLKSKTPSVKVIVVRTVENKDEIESMQKFWSDRGIQIDIRRLNNRGKSRIKETGLNPNPWHLREYCRNPFVHLNVLSNGDVNLCCVDYERKHIVGNLGESSLKEIWHGKEFNRLRSKYLRKEWDGLLCATCEITSLK